jgi:gliding motility-associated-like protein
LSSNADTYFWDFGHNGVTSNDFNPFYTYPDVPARYAVWLTTENNYGCIDSTVQFIDVVIEPIYYIPNVFTPDGDAFNNVFQPVFTSGFDPYSYKLLIFNRWGELLFESNNAEIGWDGTYGGKMVQDGVYLYKITFRDLYSDKRYDVQGHLSLLR